MPAEKNSPDLSRMPGGDLSFRSYDERLYGQILGDLFPLVLRPDMQPAPLREDYRLHVIAPIHVDDDRPRTVEAYLHLSRDEFDSFRSPAISKPESAPAIDIDDPLAIFDDLPETDESDEEATETPTVNYNLERHNVRMALVRTALARLVDPAVIDQLVDSYGTKPSDQREGVTLNAHDINQWLTVRGGGVSRWGFFIPGETTSASTTTGTNITQYTANQRSLATGQRFDSTQPSFKGILRADLQLVSDAIEKVIQNYDAQIQAKGYLQTDYATNPMLGVTAARDYFTGYTDRDAPAGQTLLGTSYSEAYYGMLGDDYRVGDVAVQTVYKDTKKSQPIVESVHTPFHGAETTYTNYRATTSGQVSGSGIRRQAFRGMYGSDRKVHGFTPERFYDTVAFIHNLGKAAAANITA